MEKHPIGDMMDTAMSRIKELVDVNTVVGQPITTPDGITLIPISKVLVGYGSGGSDFPVKEKSGFGLGNGAGIKIEPVGFLSINNGNVRMINIAPPANTSVDRLIEQLPDLVDKVEEIINKFKDKKSDKPESETVETE